MVTKTRGGKEGQSNKHLLLSALHFQGHPCNIAALLLTYQARKLQRKLDTYNRNMNTSPPWRWHVIPGSIVTKCHIKCRHNPWQLDEHHCPTAVMHCYHLQTLQLQIRDTYPQSPSKWLLAVAQAISMPPQHYWYKMNTSFLTDMFIYTI